jgi:ribonuclease P protein component
VGGAVIRNRIKRRVRECFRQVVRAMLPEGTSMVVIARPGAGGLRTAEISGELMVATLNVGSRLRSRHPE